MSWWGPSYRATSQDVQTHHTSFHSWANTPLPPAAEIDEWIETASNAAMDDLVSGTVIPPAALATRRLRILIKPPSELSRMRGSLQATFPDDRVGGLFIAPDLIFLAWWDAFTVGHEVAHFEHAHALTRPDCAVPAWRGEMFANQIGYRIEAKFAPRRPWLGFL
jgi:hypothetical protein